jgi:type 2 lantibiotic biosynthesis protein LanM
MFGRNGTTGQSAARSRKTDMAESIARAFAETTNAPDKVRQVTLSCYRALTLQERLASLPGKENGIHPDEAFDREAAEHRLGSWRSQLPFTDDETFRQRLQAEGMNEETFLRLLGESEASVAQRLQTIPDWAESLLHSIAQPRDGQSNSVYEFVTASSTQLAGFLYLAEPLIDRGLVTILEEVDRLQECRLDLPFERQKLPEILLRNLPPRLLLITSRTLVLELHVARLRGELAGTTTEARYQSFVERLRDPQVVLALLEEYPVLARQIVQAVEQWRNYSLEFLRHLAADWQDIVSTFAASGDLGTLSAVNWGQGDQHNHGRSVIIAYFSSGFRLVYKPRPLEIDVHFQQLLQWLNEKGFTPAFRPLTILARNDYGWIEFASDDACQYEAELTRFYERQGAYLALLYALEATDFHYENVIAAGEHPILIDLESLLHPRLESDNASEEDAYSEMSQIMAYSVLRIGLLPQRLWLGQSEEGVDISGMGSVEGQLSPKAVPNWKNLGTDEMRLTRQRVALQGGKNQPTYQGMAAQATDYRHALSAGFARMYRLLLHYRDELLAEGGPLAHFSQDKVRFIVRPTMVYGKVLQESYHPDVLRDALDREQLFDRLWVGIANRPYLSQVIPSERADLHNGDIPIFTTFPNSRDLWSSAGRCIPDFFTKAGMQIVAERLAQFSEKDLEKQLWFIQASLATLVMGERQASWPVYKPIQTKERPERKQLLAMSQRVGQRLQALAMGNEREAVWLGVSLVAERYWTLVPAGLDLYSGLPGIALYLGYVGAVTGDAQVTVLARAATAAVRTQRERGKEFIKEVGGFAGWGSVIYMLAHLGALWQDTSLWAEAEAIVSWLPELIAVDESLDVISGSAGCIGALLALNHCSPSQATLAAAVQCGEHLLARKSATAQGVGWWHPRMNASQSLVGFSHGAAGMAWALARLAAATGDDRFRRTAVAALAYERSHYCPEVQNWPDLRDLDDKPPDDQQDGPVYMTAWCHGAPGIGLSRLPLLSLLPDAAIEDEIEVAVNTTLRQGFGRNHSLCHGDLGNLELVSSAARRLQRSDWQRRADEVTASLLASMNQYGWLSGVPLGVETPGLMTGLSGIGYGLLRLAAPERVPSVLLLEPPL